jgi:cell division protein FtsQ
MLTLLWALTYSSLVDVDHVVVNGAAHDGGRHPCRSCDRAGQPMAYLDTRAAAHRIEALPWVASAPVRRDLPGTVRIDVVERVPVVATIDGGGWRMLDVEGHALGDVPAASGCHRDERAGAAHRSGTGGGEQLAAIDAATVLPTPLKQRVGAVTWDADGSVALELAPQGTIRLGPPTNLPAKYLAAIAVLDKLDPNKPIGVLDVRAPQAPVLAPA